MVKSIGDENGLENRRAVKRLEGSTPLPSAKQITRLAQKQSTRLIIVRQRSVTSTGYQIIRMRSANFKLHC